LKKPMDDEEYDPWVEQQIAEIQREAREECARCQGRQFKDCSDQCRYFWATATESEKEESRRHSANVKPRIGRPWEGPVQPRGPIQGIQDV